MSSSHPENEETGSLYPSQSDSFRDDRKFSDKHPLNPSSSSTSILEVTSKDSRHDDDDEAETPWYLCCCVCVLACLKCIGNWTYVPVKRKIGNIIRNIKDYFYLKRQHTKKLLYDTRNTQFEKSMNALKTQAIQSYNSNPKDLAALARAAKAAYAFNKKKNANSLLLIKAETAIDQMERKQNLDESDEMDRDQYENQPSLIGDGRTEEMLERGRVRKQITDDDLAKREQRRVEDAKAEQKRKARNLELGITQTDSSEDAFIKEFIASITGVTSETKSKGTTRKNKNVDTEDPEIVDERLYESDEKESIPLSKSKTVKIKK